MGSKLSELHSGYRAFSARLLESLPLMVNSADFVFDNQMLAQVIAKELEIYGSHGMAARDYPGMLALAASGALRPARLGVAHLPAAIPGAGLGG